MTVPSIALPLALVAFIGLVVAFPLVRHRRRTGAWALVVRRGSGAVENLVRWWMVGLLAAAGTWAVLVPSLSAARLGAWAVPVALSWLGAGLIVAALALVVVAQAHMGGSWRIGIDDAPTSLVTSGLFRWMRHPIYTGILLLGAGVVLLTPSPWTLGGALLGYLLVAIQARLEEQHLAEQHGTAYHRWAGRVGRFIPGIGRDGGAAA